DAADVACRPRRVGAGRTAAASGVEAEGRAERAAGGPDAAPDPRGGHALRGRAALLHGRVGHVARLRERPGDVGQRVRRAAAPCTWPSTLAMAWLALAVRNSTTF